MRQWSDNHPKAQLLMRKRAAILNAAAEAFLQMGYEGVSMEGIANAAGVSIMTLYRHAKRKEDLFAAVIANACDHSSADEQAEFDRLMQMPLQDALVKVGTLFQEKLASPQVTSLLRVVITEAIRFPDLAETAYNALFNVWAVTLDAFLAQNQSFRGVSAKARRKASEAFFSRLVGVDAIRMLLGLKGATAKEWRERAEISASELLAKMN
ncbi:MULTISPECIES: TetR/AcrR family transcriptional regulator [Paraburkholderia]|uniref:TetR/AcrR family transcriptional regulator n=1 Tax=Paraburkholderia dipogonis TaxID=1211383 RepID=A0A4Y8MGX1_9BURK|nr:MULTISPECIES: TetR/AcrR family transcriptional regulator [Paraburkholderia]RKR31334.1 TetR family transcriptional regulator [Paraburkholderia sp. BL17N1]TFE36697.1 TetR/AcrR family transcriptional regulator [Paraburkholderia dipogonis]